MRVNDLELALAMADMADNISHTHFNDPSLTHKLKIDGTPITEADRAIEVALSSMVVSARPDDGFLGEETGETQTSPRRWLVDGIDGTRWFVKGSPMWATLIALEIAGEIDIGIISSPALGRRYWAQRSHGAFISTGGSPATLRVSDVSSLDTATGILIPATHEIRGWQRDMALRWMAASRVLSPGWHEWSVTLLAGEVEACVYFCGEPWDHAALVAIVEEAGGQFSDVWGGRRLDTGTAVFTNGCVHDAVMDALWADAPPNHGYLPPSPQSQG